MYGLVNQAIRDMVCDHFGVETWQTIRLKADISTDMFSRMEAYPDDLTHRLVRVASEVLELSSAQIMQAFGEYWVQYTAEKGYGEMLDMSGETLPEFLENLDDLHTRIGLSFPKFKPPSFETVNSGGDSLELHYHSLREGFAPMVLGLIEGLGERFATEVDVTQVQNRDQGDEHDTFLIQYKPN